MYVYICVRVSLDRVDGPLNPQIQHTTPPEQGAERKRPQPSAYVEGKTIVLVRHGQSFYNEHYATTGSDPMVMWARVFFLGGGSIPTWLDLAELDRCVLHPGLHMYTHDELNPPPPSQHTQIFDADLTPLGVEQVRQTFPPRTQPTSTTQRPKTMTTMTAHGI